MVSNNTVRGHWLGNGKVHNMQNLPPTDRFWQLPYFPKVVSCVPDRVIIPYIPYTLFTLQEIDNRPPKVQIAMLELNAFLRKQNAEMA